MANKKKDNIKSWAELGASPAPWKCQGWLVQGGDGLNAATIGGNRHRKMCANACAIEAMPDLYEVARKLVDWDSGAKGALLDIIKEAKAALRKAAGEEADDANA